MLSPANQRHGACPPGLHISWPSCTATRTGGQRHAVVSTTHGAPLYAAPKPRKSNLLLPTFSKIHQRISAPPRVVSSHPHIVSPPHRSLPESSTQARTADPVE